MKKYYKIWKSDVIPINDNETLFCSSPLIGGEKYYDKGDALKALDELAKSNFNISKYKSKKVESITKNNDGSYELKYWHNNKIITDKYQVL